MNKQDAINVFIETISWELVISRWGLNKKTPNYFETKEFKSYWRQNPQQRPGQVLINLGLITDSNIRWEDTYLSLLSTCRKANYDKCIKYD